ncbi:MAG TPA: SEC-C domain-containing protein, partial [Iamia sp.]|nr:SEC-C domain-containing protein [Iamia sp.]
CLSGADGAEVLDADAASFLDDSLIAEALARRVQDLEDDEVAATLARARAVAGRDPVAPGPGLVLAEALMRAGEPAEARDLLARLVVGPPAPEARDWAAVHEAHGQMCAYAGDVAGAQAAFRRIGDDEAAEALQRWRPTPPAGVGRNDRCPCGSGRKAKQCCLLHPPVPALAARVPFVWWKLERACVHLRGQDVPRTGPADSLVATLAVDAHLVEDGALASVATQIGPLLPADERELAACWSDAVRGLHQVDEVDDDGLVLRDLLTDTVTVVAPGRDDAPAVVGDLWLAVVVPGPGDRAHVVGPVVRPPLAARAFLLEALGADHDGQDLVDLVSALLD